MQDVAPAWTPGFVRLSSSTAKWFHLSADSLPEVPRAQAPDSLVNGAAAMAKYRDHDPACLRFFRDGNQYLALSIPYCNGKEAYTDHWFFVVGPPGWEHGPMLVDPPSKLITAVCPDWRDRTGRAQGYPTIRCPTPASAATDSGDER
ncbi:MAG TPA: hypothetical protein VFJ96_04770 [Gemmatimonadaceae bacterium]|nr:hypothetical protein [Gemmatimonadaceae bacterium]